MIRQRAIRGELAALFAFLLTFLAVAMPPALALDAIPVDGTKQRVELTQLGLAVEGRGDRLQIDTAPDSDGISRRMSVNATTSGTNPNWIVFALRNTTDKVIERWITVQRYSLIGSGVIWPDLDSRRLSALTPSVGFLPQRIANDRADIFKITINPGQTVTYSAEMATARLSRIFMWEPLAYEFHVRERRLFNGIMLGITGLLGIFLTAVFAANHKAIFPSAALVTWCVLIYLCVDFGFWHKLLQIQADDNAVYRAAAEAAMATSLSIFLHTFLRLGNWHGFVRMLASVLIVAQVALVFVAVLDPRLASTFARLSFAALGGIGALLILFLAIRGQDRALSIIPTWLLFIVWLFGAAMTLTGKLNGDIVVSALVAGLVLITVLIGFTVTQFAFRSVEPLYGAAPSEQTLRSLAVEGAGAAVWEWHARRDEIKIGAIAEAALGLNNGELSTKVKDFVKYMHPADQERFNVLLWSVQNKNGGEIRTDFRMRHADNSYRWFDLEAASIPTSDRRSLRCVGLLRDVTDQKRSQTRLMHDAVQDSLTGLPNRELFLDRLKTSVARVEKEPNLRPTILFVDLDKFKSVNSSFGLIVGDSLLLTISRRLSRLLQPMDTLARLGGDQFAMLVLSVTEPDELARLAESVRRALRAPIKIAGQDIVLTGAIGIAVHDPASSDELDTLKDAEIAMYRAKRNGADQIEIFRPDMRDERDDRVAIESDLRRALERRQIKVHYQPIIYLPTEELAGFEALVRWEHPRHGLLNPQDFIPVAEESDLIVKLGSYVLSEAVEQAAKWQAQLPRDKHPLFVSVNVSSRQLFRQDLIQEIRHILGRSVVPEGVLRLEITESLVMENPERAAEMLDMLKIAGAGLALDDFGTGYSSLAYLERFPFDTIKIDRDLIQSSSDGQGSGPVIVRSIVAMAKELDKKIVAEGVEASETVGFLRSIGCQYAQGYYYGEPMGERDVADLLKIVRKAERKLQRRGFFGASSRKGKDAQEEGLRDEPETATPATAAEGTQPEASAHRPAPATASQPQIPPQQMPAALPAAVAVAKTPNGAPPAQSAVVPPSPIATGGDQTAASNHPANGHANVQNNGPSLKGHPAPALPPGKPVPSPTAQPPRTAPQQPQTATAPSPHEQRRMPPAHWSEPPKSSGPSTNPPVTGPAGPVSKRPVGQNSTASASLPPTQPVVQPPVLAQLKAASDAAANPTGQSKQPPKPAANPPTAPQSAARSPAQKTQPQSPAGSRPPHESRSPAPPVQSGPQPSQRSSGPPHSQAGGTPRAPQPKADAPPEPVVLLPLENTEPEEFTLPPSIAQSLARLAGTPEESAAKQPANDENGRRSNSPKLEAGE